MTTQRKPTVSHSIPLFKIFGIEIRLDLSVAIIFGLIVFSLGSGVFPQWHPDWGPGLVWLTAVTSGVLFFASLLAHELAHSVVSQKYGIPVPRITLFLFGGMAEVSREPDTAKVEFFVAIAGPLMSIAISLICTNLAFWLADDAMLAQRIAEADTSVLAELSPVSTSLLWLGSINMILALFNLIPGFPMDGGRVFRAMIWQITGDQLKATRWASNGGRIFGWTLMVLGVFELFAGAGLGAVWYILIGWFISNLATMSYRQLIADRALKGFRVGDLMTTHFEVVAADLGVRDFIEHHLLRSAQSVWPVYANDELVGFVALVDVVALSNDARASMAVRNVMRPMTSVPHLRPDTGAQEALAFLASADIEPVPVLQDGRLIGLIERGDIVKWMSLHEL